MIGSVSPEQRLSEGTTSADIWADGVATTGVIGRVWAVITPPGYSPTNPADPVLDMPTIDLVDVGNNRYEGTYNSFTGTGTYNITVYAMDTLGNMSSPKKTTVKRYPTGSEVIPYITANGSGEAVSINTTDNLTIKIELDSGTYKDRDADWWLVVKTLFLSPNDWYYYNITTGSFLPGLTFTYQGALSDLPKYEILNMTGLPVGTYKFYIGIDMNMNGTLDMGELYLDEVEVNVN